MFKPCYPAKCRIVILLTNVGSSELNESFVLNCMSRYLVVLLSLGFLFGVLVLVFCFKCKLNLYSTVLLDHVLPFKSVNV